MAFMLTKTGKKFDPFQPIRMDICIEDIAHALSHVCRFAGHTNKFYSVADHSCRVAERVGQLVDLWHAENPEGRAKPSLVLKSEMMLLALLHDSTEAYLPDLVRPFKSRFFVEYEGQQSGRYFGQWESDLLDAIHERFGLPANMVKHDTSTEQLIGKADLELLVTEARDLMIDCEWAKEIPAKPLEEVIQPLSSELAKAKYLSMFNSFRAACA